MQVECRWLILLAGSLPASRDSSYLYFSHLCSMRLRDHR